jgi:hypothetical protein
MRSNNGWYIFENVSARVCVNCGRRYFNGPSMLELERMIKEIPERAYPIEAWLFNRPTTR